MELCWWLTSPADCQPSPFSLSLLLSAYLGWAKGRRPQKRGGRSDIGSLRASLMTGIPFASSSWTPDPCSSHGWGPHHTLSGFPSLKCLCAQKIPLPTTSYFCDLFALTGSPLGQNTAKKTQAHLTFSVIQIACGNSMLTYLTKERMNSQSVLTLFSYPAHDGCMGHQDRQSTMLIMFSDTQGMCQPPGACVAPKPRHTCQSLQEHSECTHAGSLDGLMGSAQVASRG